MGSLAASMASRAVVSELNSTKWGISPSSGRRAAGRFGGKQDIPFNFPVPRLILPPAGAALFDPSFVAEAIKKSVTGLINP